ncbi:hypothetical protein HZH68_009005 [Vespula germanica]|uniref:Uncharacterized protein n=1 Tax=Vespula germanica TaxID=30212 RepID=A0A834K0B5_VESGE|nr:hypothetical protein HZH68_009005 [Vespula germanica]
MQHEGSASVVLRFSACAAANEKKGHVALVAGARRRWWTRSRAPDRRTRRTMSVACSSHVRRQPDEEEDAEEEEVEEDEPEEKRQRAAGSGACGGACGRERSELLGFYLCKHETLDTHGGDSPGCIGGYCRRKYLAAAYIGFGLTMFQTISPSSLRNIATCYCVLPRTVTSPLATVQESH